MSLINEMLQDLEKRRASPPEHSGVPRYVRVLPPAHERRMRWSTVSAAAGIVLVAGATWYLYEKRPQQLQAAPGLVNPVAMARAETATVQNSPPPPVKDAVQ